jgi:hypothetical protein
MAHPNYLLRTSIALALLLVPPALSRLGFGAKRHWGWYSLYAAGFLALFTVADWLVGCALDLVGQSKTLLPLKDSVGISFVFAICAFLGGSFAEAVSGRMRR